MTAEGMTMIPHATLDASAADLCAARAGTGACARAAADRVRFGYGTAAAIRWGAATRINRMDPLILGFAAALGVTDQQLDALFA